MWYVILAGVIVWIVALLHAAHHEGHTMGKEKPIVDKILAYLNGLPHRQGKAIKIHMDPYMEKGTPDIFACVKGVMFTLEVKRSPDEKPDAIQQVRLNQWEQAGAVAVVVSSLEEVRDLLAARNLT